MHRRKVIVAAGAAFALGVALAAQPTSERADRESAGVQQNVPWMPGTNMLMTGRGSPRESRIAPLAPPR